MIVISDDIDLDVGNIRIRPKGSAGGHNGLKNIISQLGTQEFTRVRIGVGAKKEGRDLVSHVLGKIDKSDTEVFEEAISNVVEAVETIMTDGCETAMNRFNKKKSDT